MLSFIRQAITANGGTPSSFSPVGAWRQLVTAYGGTPTQYTVTGLMREAIVAVGGTPTKWTERDLLRELLAALGETVTSYRLRDLYEQLAAATTGPDVTAPTLTSPTGAQTGGTTATVGVTTNEADGTLYHYISTSATPPSAANLKSGSGAVVAGSQAITSTGAKSALITGLTSQTTYYAHFLHRDAAGNDSSIATSASFATPDVTAPTITSSNPSNAYDQSSTVGGTLTADETVTWSKSGTGASSLTLNTSTGVWSLDTSALGALDITITATDSASNTSIQAWSFTIVAVTSGVPTPTLTWVSDTATYDPVFSLTEITESDVVQLQIDDNSDFSSTYGDDSNTIDAAEALAGTLTFSILTLGLGTTYYARARYTRAGTTSSWSTAVSKTMDADATAPTLSSPTDTANGATGATISVSTNEGNGTLYYVVTTSSTAPSVAQVKAGQNNGGTAAAASGSQAVSGTGVQNASPTGLTASTAYYTYFVHTDAAGNNSTVSAADGFTTAAAPTLPSSGLILQLDADDTSTLFQTITGTTAPADGQPIGTWNDKSGNAFHMTAAANDTTRPTYRTNSGLPYVEFDNTQSQVLRRLAALGMYSGGACTVMLAMKQISTNQTSNNLGIIMEGNSAAANAVYEFGAAATNALGAFIRNDANTVITISGLLLTVVIDGTDQVVAITDDGSNLQAYDDGVPGTARTYTRAGVLTLNRTAIGGWVRNTTGSWYGVKIYSIAVWNRVLNSTERAQARTYMGAKQGRVL